MGLEVWFIKVIMYDLAFFVLNRHCLGEIFC